MDTCSFLVPFALFRYALASPTSKPQSDGQPTNVIYVVLAILIVLGMLAIVKYFYMKSRKATCIHLSSKTSSNYYDPFSLESSSASLQTGSDVSEQQSGNDKSGFMVGLLGSPAWETKIQSRVDAVACKQHLNSSFTYQLHTQSRQRSFQPYQPQWKAPSISPPKHPSAGDGNCRGAIRLSKSSSLHLPKDTRISHDPRPRRLSLPSRGRKRSAPSDHSNGDGSSKRSRSSSRSTRKRSVLGLKTSRNIISTGASPRMMDETGDTDNQMARSSVFSSSSSPLFLSNPFPPRFKARTSRKPVSPLPSLPTPDPFSSAENASSTSIPSPIQISCPMPLRPQPDRDSIPVPNDSLKGRSRDSRLYQELLPVLRPLDVSAPAQVSNQYMPPKKPDFPPATRQPLSSITHATNCTAGTCTLASLKTSPPISSVPILAQKAVSAKPRTKQKSKNDPQSRARRSSSLGPSPLRVMILPDASSSGSDILVRSDKENHRTHCADDLRPVKSSERVDMRYSGFGEFGELSGKHSLARVVDQDPKLNCESTRASMNAKKASKILLSIPREREGAGGPNTSPDTSQPSPRRSWSQSREVDLGLLGLDRFIGASKDCSDGMKDDSEIDFVSFWEAARLLDVEDRRRYVVVF